MSFFTYLFWPNPGNATYGSPKALALLAICILLIVAGVALRQWRRKLQNPVTKKLSRSWPAAAFWFGIVGLFLVVVRVEEISYVSMRFWWLVWAIILVVYLFIQAKLFRARHYRVLPREGVEADPMEKYLPKKKKRK